MWLVKRPRLRLAHSAVEDRKRICCSTCGQAKSVLSEQGRVWVRQQASTHWRTTESNRIDGPFIFESSHRLWYLYYARTCIPPCACEL